MTIAKKPTREPKAGRRASTPPDGGAYLLKGEMQLRLNGVVYNEGDVVDLAGVSDPVGDTLMKQGRLVEKPAN